MPRVTRSTFSSGVSSDDVEAEAVARAAADTLLDTAETQHEIDTTNVHGILDTSALLTSGAGFVTSGSLPTSAAPTVVLGTSAAVGSATSFLASGATIVAFDGTSPSTQAVGDSAAVGTIAYAARRDHKHAMPAFATPSIALGTAAAAGSATSLNRSDATIAAFDGTAPSTQAFGDAAAVGTIAFAARRDHKHAMPANPLSAGVITGASGYIGNIVDSALADKTGSGLIEGCTSASALSQGDVVYLDSGGNVGKADANVAATMYAYGICLTTAAATSAAVNVLTHGLYRNDALYNWTIGAVLYLSETSGALTATAPTTTDAADSIIAIAKTADIVSFRGGLNFPTHT